MCVLQEKRFLFPIPITFLLGEEAEIVAMAQPTAASSREKARKKMFVGTFVHNVSLQEVSVLEGYAVGVDESGVIAFVEKIEGVGVDRLRERMGWKGEEVDIVGPGLGDESEDEDVVGFWFPGFVGRFSWFFFFVFEKSFGYRLCFMNSDLFSFRTTSGSDSLQEGLVVLDAE